MDAEPLLAQGATTTSSTALALSSGPANADSPALHFAQQTPYQPGPYQPLPYQQPYQQQPYQQQPYQQPYGYGAPTSYAPTTAYGGVSVNTVNGESPNLVGSAAPFVGAPQVSVESLYRDFERVRTSVLVLIVLHCIFWFPLGLIFIECHDVVGRGRRHWTKSICFFTLSLLTCCILNFFYRSIGICMLPHIIIAVRTARPHTYTRPGHPNQLTLGRH